MSVCQCPHCGSPHQIRVTGSGRVSKKQQCEQCGGFIGKLFSGVKKLASNPMVQQAARALAPMAMNALQRHAPGLANVVNRGVNFARQHSGAIQSALSNPRQFAQQQLPGLARQLAPRALQAVESRAPGLASAARNIAANPMVQRMASSPMAQSGLAALRSRVGMGRRGPRLSPHEQLNVFLETGVPHTRAPRGGIKLMAAKKLLGNIPGMPGSQQAPPPPPRAAFQGIQGFEAPRMRPRASVRGRGTRPPTAHALAVGEVMRTMGMSLPQASRYVSQNGLAV
jgi:hypothetical protein